MIHTVEIRTKSSDYQSFLRFKENPNLCRSYPGIEIIPKREGKGKGQYQYKLSAKINLCRVIEPDNILGIYKGRNAALILDTINQAFSELGLPAVNFWKLSRVDFTVDIQTPYISEYLSILWHGEHKEKPEPVNDGLYIHYSDRGVTVNIYSKEAEQRARGREETAAQARNLLRIEVQCHDKKLATMFAKHTARPGLDLASLLTINQGDALIDMVHDTVGKELLYIVGVCDYIRLDNALSKIEAIQGSQERVLFDLGKILAKINRKNGSISKARASWCKATGKAERVFRSRLKLMLVNGINPICLPSDSPLDHLESLYQLFLDAFMEECSTET